MVASSDVLPEPVEGMVATGSEVQFNKTATADEDSALKPNLTAESSSGQGDPAMEESAAPGPEQGKGSDEGTSTEATEGKEVNTD